MDPATILPVFAQYGLTGVVLACCGYYVYQHDKACNEAHKRMAEDANTERTEWMQLIAEQHKEAMVAANKASEALVSNTQVLSELATIIRRLK